MWAAIFSVTKVLLEHSDTIHLLNIYGYFYATKGSSSFDRDHMLTKPEIFIIWLFMGKIVDLRFTSLILSYIPLPTNINSVPATLQLKNLSVALIKLSHKSKMVLFKNQTCN